MKNRMKINKKDGMELSLVPPQSLVIGNGKENGIDKDNEGPPVRVNLSSFFMSKTTVTNKEFLIFIKETNYITEAELINSSLVFRGLINLNNRVEGIDYHRTSMPWWVEVTGANWKHPEGPGTSINNRLNHPVVHITWHDAIKYCEWAGGRLPTEAEWETAARGGVEELDYPWGNELSVNGKFMANTWQGNFPLKNEGSDGYIGTSPAKEFYVNDYGIHQMIGNVWEWCLNPARIPLESFINKNHKDFSEDINNDKNQFYAIRGGSFLCHHSYCNRYRTAARNGNTRTSSASNQGFRYVIDID